MATATKNLEYVAMAYVSNQYPTRHYSVNDSTLYNIQYYTPETRMLFKLESMPSGQKHKKLLGIQFLWFITPHERYDANIRIYAYKTDYNASVVTWNTQPSGSGSLVAKRDLEYHTATNYWSPASLSGTNSEAAYAGNALHAKSFSLEALGFGEFNVYSVLASGKATPYARVTYDDAVTVASKIQYKSGPKSGYKNPRNAITFSWDYVKASSSQYCADESWSQSSATFYWKKSTDGSYTSVSISGNTKSKTIAANTFPTASTIQWYVSGTDEDGTTTQTPVYSFSTAAGSASATPTAPINSVEDGSAPITFRWNLSSTDGQAPSRVAGQWKLATDNSWTSMFDVSSAITSRSVSAGTFTAGEINWRVRAYNVDGTAGSWSSQMSFICVAAPDPVEGLSATEVPLTTISWQSDGQEAYEISIDGEVVQKAYGTVYSWQVPTPLEDGDHLISVRVQGVYGLWSQPSEITITIANVPPLTLTLNGKFNLDAVLVAALGVGETEPDPLRVQWYRDGKRIAVTGSFSFTDRLCLGRHEYYCEIWDADGNYTRSNTLAGNMATEYAMISLLSGGDWMSLANSDSSNGGQTFDRSKTSAMLRVTGSKYPVLEMSEFETLSGSYRAAFKYGKEVEQFERFFGRPVIIKSKSDVVVGAIIQVKKTVNTFYTAYSFAVQQIHWEDFVNDQGD